MNNDKKQCFYEKLENKVRVGGFVSIGHEFYQVKEMEVFLKKKHYYVKYHFDEVKSKVYNEGISKRPFLIGAIYFE